MGSSSGHLTVSWRGFPPLRLHLQRGAELGRTRPQTDSEASAVKISRSKTVFCDKQPRAKYSNGSGTTRAPCENSRQFETPNDHRLPHPKQSPRQETDDSIESTAFPTAPRQSPSMLSLQTPQIQTMIGATGPIQHGSGQRHSRCCAMARLLRRHRPQATEAPTEVTFSP